MMLLHDLLDKSAARDPERWALCYRDTTLTYGELRAMTVSTAAGLQRLGVQRGDRVAVQLPNRLELVELFLACSRIGAVCVPVNPTLKPRQLKHVLNDSGACVLVVAGALLPQHDLAIADCRELQTVVIVDEARDRDTRADVRYVSMTELRSADAINPVRVIDADVAALFYTSGSSGRAKGVVVSHRNLVSGAQCVAAYLENIADDRILAALPLSFDYGFSQVSTAFYVGASVLLANYFSPAALVNYVKDYKITGFAAIPAIWNQLAGTKWPVADDISLRYITSSGGVLSQPVIKKLSSVLSRTKIFSMYGLTEAFRSTYLEPGELSKRPTSIGKAVPNQEILVLRADGTECLPNETGELVHRGSFVTLGYWRDPGLTAVRFRPRTKAPNEASLHREDICVWSGDLVRRDEDGFIYYVGRADQQIKVSGMRVSPAEVEEVIVEVEGVVEAVVVGVADEALGQVIGAAVLAHDLGRDRFEERIREHCKGQLPAHMVPEILRVVTQLPRTANGKPDRIALAEQLAQRERA